MQRGFLIYVPVYRGGNVPTSIEERRTNLLGFVYSPFRVGDLMDGIIGRGIKSRILLRLYDEKVSDETLLHTLNTVGRDDIPFLHLPLHEQNRLEIAGRRWILDWKLEIGSW
jgi:CHASE1-domain containing sensor protein